MPNNPCDLGDAVAFLEGAKAVLQRLVNEGPEIFDLLQAGLDAGVASNAQDMFNEIVLTAEDLLKGSEA